MSQTLRMRQVDLQYITWLESQIEIPNNKRYDGLLERMHNTEFHWTVPNDDNRMQDALDLRHEYVRDKLNPPLNLLGATMLEVLISLSRRVAFTAGGTPEKWAWQLLKNLRLHKYSDPLSAYAQAKIDDILDAVIWRTYEPNGQGGFFPLRRPDQDQTKVEIWYQMNKYVMEQDSL